LLVPLQQKLDKKMFKGTPKSGQMIRFIPVCGQAAGLHNAAVS